MRVEAHGLWLTSWLRFITRFRLAPFVPTPHDVAARMLRLGKLQPGERVVDLGSGDGRLLRAAVTEFGAARADGFELDDNLVVIAQQEATALGEDLASRITTHHQDAHDSADALRTADVVTLYLSDRGNASVLPLLRQSLHPRARVVSYAWEMPEGVPPTRSARLERSMLQLHLYEGLGTNTE